MAPRRPGHWRLWRTPRPSSRLPFLAAVTRNSVSEGSCYLEERGDLPGMGGNKTTSFVTLTCYLSRILHLQSPEAVAKSRSYALLFTLYGARVGEEAVAGHHNHIW